MSDVCEQCGEVHLTPKGYPACPGHLRNGTRHGVQVRPIGAACRLELGKRTIHPGFGLCYVHGGALPNIVQAAQREIAEYECARLSIEVDIGPAEALMRLVRKQQGVVDFLDELLATMPRVHPEDDEITGYSDDGKPIYRRGEPGIYGRTYHVSGIPTGEAKPNVLYTMWREAKRDLAEFTAAALRAGVEERLISVQESARDELTETYVRALLGGIEAAGLSEPQAEVLRHAIADALRRESPAELGGPARPSET